VTLIYLDSALSKLRTEREAEGRSFTRDDLHAAIMKGAVERVRPKMMTVAAIVDLKLPIPEAMLVLIPTEWIAIIPDDQRRKRAQASSPIGFGSRLVTGGYSIWTPDSRISEAMVDTQLQTPKRTHAIGAFRPDISHCHPPTLGQNFARGCRAVKTSRGRLSQIVVARRREAAGVGHEAR